MTSQSATTRASVSVMADLSFEPDRDAIDTPIAPQHGAEEGKVKEDKGFFTICSLIILISSTIIVFL